MRFTCVKVGDLCEQIRGVSYEKGEALTSPRPGYVPILRANNITDRGLVYDELVYVPEQRVSAYQRLRRFDVVIAASSGSKDVVGKAAPVLDDFDGSFGAFCKVLRPNQKVDPRYFAHFFKTKHYRQTVSALAAGANISNLRNEHLEDLDIPLPSLSEQMRIAEVLDRAETLIALRRQSLSLLSALVEAVFYETFGDPSRNHYAWQVAELGEFIEFGPQNGLYKPSSLYGSGTPILRIDSFYDGTITDQTALKRVAVSDAERNVYGLQPGDIVINRVNSLDYLGKCALVPTLNEPTIFESNMMRIRVDPNRLHPRFLVHLLQSNYIKSQILQKAKKAVNQASINQQDVRMLRVILPPISLQHQFVRHVESIEKHKIVHRTSLAQLEALYASLQHRAFRGEL